MNGTATFGDGNMGDMVFKNYGSVYFSGGIQLQSTQFNNYGSAYLIGNTRYNVTSSNGVFNNNGAFTVQLGASTE